MLRTIERIEQIADMLPEYDTFSREANALVGQLTGAVSAIIKELNSYGIDTSNSTINDLSKKLTRTDDAYDAVHLAHVTAGFLRALIEDL